MRDTAGSDPDALTPAGTAPRRPGRPSLSNEALLDTALDLFLAEGFEGTSIDAITAAAGMAKRTVYMRYGNKEALFRAALERAIEAWIVPIAQLRAAETGDLEETLIAVGGILVENVMRPAGIRLLRITNAESVRRPEIGEFTYERGTGQTIDYLADLLRRSLGEARPEIDDWRETAIAFLNLVVGGPPTLAAWGVKLAPGTVERHTGSSVRLFLHGLLPRGPADGMERLHAENRKLRKLLVDALLAAGSHGEADA